MATESTNETFKVVVLGAAGVGKSAIISQFLSLHWFTIELESQTTLIGEEGRQMSLEIVDIPGGYCFGARRRMAIESGDAFILVFSLDNECSFETVAMIRDDILRTKRNKKCPILLVGNKNDIEADKRITGKTGAERFARQEWKTKYMEVCAKDNNSVKRMFQKLLKLAKFKVKISSDGQRKMSRFSFKMFRRHGFNCLKAQNRV
ncbi:ras-related protein Rap-2a-like [Haliotis asinina]|uniref:ras-related protein Rap-2a-like n=1 Tax=Haliotis asinina TaxID=109174 RepID=UPI00353206CD